MVRPTVSPAKKTKSSAKPLRKGDGHQHGAAAHSHDHEERADQLLRDSGLRVTKPRMAVLTALLEAHRPVSAQDLLDSLSRDGIDSVTVYRTLNTLVEENIAQAVGTTERGRRFEVHAGDGCQVDHPHLQCRSCGDMACMEQGLLPASLVPTVIAGFLVEKATLYLTGVCAKCR